MVFSDAINVEMTLFEIGEYFVTFLGVFVGRFPINFNTYELLIPCKLLIIDICQLFSLTVVVFLMSVTPMYTSRKRFSFASSIFTMLLLDLMHCSRATSHFFTSSLDL